MIVLDIMMPHSDGYEVCRQVREHSSVPIIMLSAKDGQSDKLSCLELGADDFLTKPFSLTELLCRIKALLRRSQNFSRTAHESRYISGDFEID
ncbi:MAG TPA: response regulator transcription factor [Dehalococcoidales bacterium]